MAVNHSDIFVVGCGPGAPEHLTDAACRAVAAAEALVGSRRLLDLFADGASQSRTVVEGDVAAALAAIETYRDAGRRVAVLVSGDPGLFSLARCVAERFGRANCRFIPGISSVQLAFARQGVDWSDARILSAHAQAPQANVEELCRFDKLAVLGGGREGWQWIAGAAAALAETHDAILCENLSLDSERIRRMTPAELASADAASLCLVLFFRRSMLL
jgi:precorrin-6y C5,15-methyltransferase (decarboxylating) CbiE subunit